MRKLFLLALVSGIICLMPTTAKSQTDNHYIKKGCTYLASSVIVIGSGLLTYDLLERTYYNRLMDKNDIASRTLTGTKLAERNQENLDKYNSSVKTALYIRRSAIGLGIILAMTGSHYVNKDGSVTVASKGNTSLGVRLEGTTASLCLHF